MQKKKLVLRITIAILLIIFAIFSHIYDKRSNEISLDSGNIRVHFINVGQGDSIFIELGNQKCMLIDTGTKSNVNTIIDYIKSYGYKSLNYAVLTHFHDDHGGSYPQLIERIPIENFYISNYIENNTLHSEIHKALNTQNISVNRIGKNDVIFNERGVKITVLAPPSFEYKLDNDNDNSMVLMLEYGKISFLFTSDASKATEEYIKDIPECDVLKVAHHGSKNATSKEFLSAVNPDIAVITCGYQNEYNHPDAELLERLESQNIEILRSDYNGNIVFESNGSELKNTTQRTKDSKCFLCKYITHRDFCPNPNIHLF